LAISKKAAVVASVLSLAVGLGAGFGAGSLTHQGGAGSVPSATSTSASSGSAVPAPSASPGVTQADAKKTVDAFFAQVAADTDIYESNLGGGKTDAQISTAFDESFSKTFTFLKPDALTSQTRHAMVAGFAQFYIIDPGAKIEAPESAYELNGNTATVKASDFVIMLHGKVQEQKAAPSGKSGQLTLTLENGKWLISGFETAGK